MTILIACREAVAKAVGLALLDVPALELSAGPPRAVRVEAPSGPREVVLSWSATDSAVLASALAFRART